MNFDTDDNTLGLKVGDRVRVTGGAAGFPHPSGTVGTVKGVDRHGIWFTTDGGSGPNYGYFYRFEKIEPEVNPLTEASAFLGKYVIVTRESHKYPLTSGLVSELKMNSSGHITLMVGDMLIGYGGACTFTEWEG